MQVCKMNLHELHCCKKPWVYPMHWVLYSPDAGVVPVQMYFLQICSVCIIP